MKKRIKGQICYGYASKSLSNLLLVEHTLNVEEEEEENGDDEVALLLHHGDSDQDLHVYVL